jgi:hypothetical protein
MASVFDIYLLSVPAITGSNVFTLYMSSSAAPPITSHTYFIMWTHDDPYIYTLL